MKEYENNNRKNNNNKINEKILQYRVFHEIAINNPMIILIPCL